MISVSTAAAAAALAANITTLRDVKIGNLVVSACTGLSGPSELLVTEKPIGTGYPISDAAVSVPLEKTVDIIFTTPQYSAEQLAAAIQSGSAASITGTWVDDKNELYDLQTTREIVKLQTHEGSYPNMIISLIVPVFDNIENWDGWIGAVTLKQINYASTEPEGGLVDATISNKGNLAQF
jgi:hypothetical protein